ncbi:5'-nucleotidase domain-containing protein 1 [Eupeodes corollae]|uniref:5'-nucleotidase domain-containing protein 1 n=1 Tax=Eupeodes corollae TaxID=290404 RepID=UPI002492AF3E|nr:5'-nucleotidase domain-containing protein 1 [Eupeodes corollae]XP_055909719.1 5'-nucleotidase domain-containing protein 1 [Eupeodes corollae]
MRPHSKSFSFNDYDVIGFDLDGTILRYNLDEMVPLEYELLCQFLVEHKGYSKNLSRLLDKPDDIDFLQKGLFLDAERGNLLKLDNNGCILRANHGTRAMTDSEIVAVYGEERKWSVTTQFINEPLCAWNGPLAEKLRSLLDYFDISVSLVFANAIDEVDACKKSDHINEKASYNVWADILEGLIHIYTRENFSNGKSGYFEKLKSDPDRFLLKTSPVVIDWLRELKASNKKLFLLTGSHIDFANFTASYALGDNWRDLFDVVICFARKPGFFHGSREFHQIEGFQETDPIALDGELHLNKVYSMGNWKQLQKFFAQSIDIDVSKINSLYVGDNLIQDVYAPEALAGMDSVAISEEMLSESVTDSSNNFKNITASRYWNSYFYHDGMPTLWTHIITKHSKMCVPTLEHAATKPIDYKFMMSNEFGFYPSPPVVE